MGSTLRTPCLLLARDYHTLWACTTTGWMSRWICSLMDLTPLSCPCRCGSTRMCLWTSLDTATIHLLRCYFHLSFPAFQPLALAMLSCYTAFSNTKLSRRTTVFLFISPGHASFPSSRLTNFYCYFYHPTVALLYYCLLIFFCLVLLFSNNPCSPILAFRISYYSSLETIYTSKHESHISRFPFPYPTVLVVIKPQCSILCI